MLSCPSPLLAQAFLAQLQWAPAVLVQVVQTQGSVPREVGTWMAVFEADALGTIGGGHLEYQAVAVARARLLGQAAGADPAPDGAVPVRYALGPALGQCCGGVVFLRYEAVTALDLPTLAQRLAPRLQPVALFGAGHVGHALVRVLAALPFALTWVDSRDSVFPADLPPGVVCEYSDPVQAAVANLQPQSRVLVMSFSHAEDLEVIAACLKRQREQSDLGFIGLLGSKTKWATFRQRLLQRGFAEDELAGVTCPVGVPGIAGKDPEVIAVAVAAQLLQSC
ncbi:MAG: xanthine dehydrogenase accessory protein XdhC [Burkholderiaceae bacterium]